MSPTAEKGNTTSERLLIHSYFNPAEPSSSRQDRDLKRKCRVLPAHSKSEIARAFDKVKEALRNQYAIGCKPAEFKPDGTFRSIQIVPRAAGAVPSRLFRAAGRPGERVVCDGAVSELKFSD